MGSIYPWYVYPSVGLNGISVSAERRDVNRTNIATFFNLSKTFIFKLFYKRVGA